VPCSAGAAPSRRRCMLNRYRRSHRRRQKSDEYKNPHTKLMNVSLVRSRPLVSAVVVRCSAPVRFPARHNRSRAAIFPSRSSSSRSLACTRILSTHSLSLSFSFYLSLSFFLSLSLSLFCLYFSLSFFFSSSRPRPRPRFDFATSLCFLSPVISLSLTLPLYVHRHHRHLAAP
jgi:hypothetical protein